MAELHDLSPSPGSHRAPKRKGRGPASGNGKTAGRGQKGQKSRSGGKVPAGFEGGQMPLQRRMPKLRGFRNPNRVEYAVVNVERLNDFDAGSTVSVDDLRARGLVKHRGRVKVLGEGDLDRALTIKAHAFSLGAVEKIKAAGGSVEVVED